VIQDTTQPSFERNRGNIKHPAGLGVIGNNADLGFFLHPWLVVEASGSRCIGYSNVVTWSPEAGATGKTARHYPQQPLEEKQSYPWIQAGKQSKQVLESAGELTIIADREGDINELFQQLPDESTHLLVGCCQDGLLTPEPRQAPKLYAPFAQQPQGGRFGLALKGDGGANPKKPTACSPMGQSRIGSCRPQRPSTGTLRLGS